MKEVLIVLPILLFGLSLISLNRKYTNLIFTVNLIIVFLILGFQDNFGTDYNSYIKIFYNPDILKYSRGPLYKLISIFFLKTTGHSRTIFLFMAFLNIMLMKKITLILEREKLIKNINYFFIFLIIYIYINMFNAIRNSFADLCLTYAIILFIYSHSWIKVITYMILGALFHPSILIWTPIFLMKKFIAKRRTGYFVGIVLLLSLLINELNLIPMVAKWIYHSIPFNFPYKRYLISYHMFSYKTELKRYNIAQYPRFVFIVLSLLQYIRLKERSKIIMYNIGYLGAILYFLFVGNPILSRVANELNIFIVILNFRMLKNYLRRSFLFLGIFGIIFFYLMYMRSIYGMIASVQSLVH